MSVLILGCGQLGYAVGTALVAMGMAVHGVRRTPMAEPSPFPIHATNVGHSEDLAALAGRVPSRIDTIIVSAYPALRHDQPDPLPACLTACGRLWSRARLIYTSSTQIYADAAGAWVDEYGAYAGNDPAHAFLSAEQRVLERPEGLVLRLGQIVSRGRLLQMRSRVASPSVTVPGDPDRWLNYIHEYDIVDVMRIACHDDRLRGCYNLVHPSPIRVRDWLLTIAAVHDMHIAVHGSDGSMPNRRIDARRIRAACPSIGWHDLRGTPCLP
ncbi:MAG: hypothetical protein J0M02_02370 [Planctomycetes bacterium]|nr:hypothetical protein [Planctomycetota bacterium]